MGENTVNKYKNKIVTIPNILTLVRLGLIPIFVWLYSFKAEYSWATAILALSALTDIADGFIARKFKMISDFGKIVDPIADKLTQLCALICLVFRFKLMFVPLVLIVIKELFSGIVTLVRLKKTKAVPSAVWHGKVTTTLLYGTMILHVIWWNIPTAVSHVSVLLCTVMMLLSAVLYSIQHFKAIKNTNNQSKAR